MTQPTLSGQNIKLTPLTDAHYDELQAIVLANPDVYRYTTIGASRAAFARWFTLAQQQRAWTVVRLADSRAVGSTRLYRLDEAVGAVCVGYTWYAPDCRGTGINDEAKLLLLAHIFETLKLNRVQFEINADNIASRRAVEKLGATLEGTLRAHRRRTTTGELADTCIYGLLADEWGQTQQQLQQKIKSRNS